MKLEEWMIPVVLGSIFITFMVGLFIGSPTKLNNGCYVIDKNVYCEVSNE